MKRNPKTTKSLAHLKKVAGSDTGDFTEFYILLAGGIARRSKRIVYHTPTKTFDVYNEIDASYQEDLTDEQLASETNIVDAIDCNVLIQY
jgi:hypothetical protein